MVQLGLLDFWQKKFQWSFFFIWKSSCLAAAFHTLSSSHLIEKAARRAMSNCKQWCSRAERNRCFSCQARDSHNSKRQQLQLMWTMMLPKRWKQVFFSTHWHCLVPSSYSHFHLCICVFIYCCTFVLCFVSFALFSTQRQCLAPLSYSNFPFCRT